MYLIITKAPKGSGGHSLNADDDDDDVYLDKSQTRGVKKSILYMSNVDYSQ
jgi:hypothetical protein